MNVSIRIKGIEKVRAAIDQEQLQPYLERAAVRAARIVRRVVAKYPRARRNDRRTGRLGRGWGIARSYRKGHQRSIVAVSVLNREPYAHIVQGGTSTRSWYREVGWVQTSDLVEDLDVMGRVTDAFGDEIDRY